MNVLLSSLLWFLPTFALHIVFCRFFPRRHSAANTAGLFGAAFVVGAGGLAWYLRMEVAAKIAVTMFHAALLYAAFAGPYLLFYVGATTRSPARIAVQEVGRSGLRGLSRDDLACFYNDKDFILPRLKQLEAAGFLVVKDGHYVLGVTGLRLLKAATFVRQLYRLPGKVG